MHQNNNVEVFDFDRSTQIYLKDIGKKKPLKRRDEYNLWQDYHRSKDINTRNRMVEANLKFVTNVAKWYKGRGLSYNDLIEEGNIGLIRAMDKFDASKGYKVISYAVHWIRQSIMEALEKRNSLGGDELPSERVNRDISIDEDGEVQEIETDPAFTLDTESPEEIDAEQIEKKAFCNKLLSVLSEREADIIIRNFGLAGETETLEEIGKDLGITKERTRQIKEQALRKMREEALFL